MVSKRVEEIIDGLLNLQDRMMNIVDREPWLQKEAEEGKGRIAQIEVYDLQGTYSKRLKVTDDLRIVETEEEPVHLIRCHVDSFLDILGGDLTFGDAYSRGLIDFQGKDFHVHAMKWARAFQKYRGYLPELGF